MRSLLGYLIGAAIVGQALAAEIESGPFVLEIAPAAFGERCVKLAAGESIWYQFRGEKPVDFNIHYHRGKDVVYRVKVAKVRERNGRFRAKHADTYCLMWENAAATTTATVAGDVKRTPSSRSQ